MRYLVVAEADEVFMDSQDRGWMCGASNGEGLSRVLAADAYPPGMAGFFSAGSWLNSEHTDYVTHNDWSDTNFKSIGCSTLFLYYLQAQLGFGWSQIVQVGGHRFPDPNPSLAYTFSNLTGRTDAFDSFYSLVTRRFPYGVQAELATDNPFPLKPDLLFYARSAGIGQLYATNLAGDIGLLSTYTDWRTTWTLIVPMHFSGARHSDVLFYNAAAGLGELYSTNGLGELNPIVHRYTDWRTSWSIIVAGSFTGTGFSDLLFYDRAAGTGEFYRTDEHGNLTFLTGHTDWLTTWSQIVVGNDPHGTMTLRRTYEDWRTDWSLIHTGNFADHV
jgi:hypothetical protein